MVQILTNIITITMNRHYCPFNPQAVRRQTLNNHLAFWSIQSTMPLKLTIQGPGGLPPRQAASSRYILLRRGNDTAHFESEQRAWNTGDWATSPSIRANTNQQRGAKDPARAPTLEAFMRKKKHYVECGASTLRSCRNGRRSS